MKISSSDKFRIAPLIPDHEMLRLIGKGSYGEVWLARSVTGAMRAVKVVQRSDFQHDRTFEREFEGLRKFEPISRSHPGLVDVLHVGRNLNAGFYYYVMELGDDRVRGTEIIPELYVARTLASDINEHGRLNVLECVEAGANLADGLQYLHQRGLTHRDVKPSNVIFVDGVAKLADIGLVAASGQRTFVGTEGFVPPEGPGSPAADIYSLGMVLYEISTGNDRLEFPELPNRLPVEAERPRWRALNAVICQACAQKPKDRYAAAADFAQALRRIKLGKVRRKTLRGKLFRMVLVAGLLGALLVAARHRDFLRAVADSRTLMAEIEERGFGGGAVPFAPEPPVIPPVEPPVAPPIELPVVKKTGRVKIQSDPGVMVLSADGEKLGVIDASGVKTLGDVPIGPVSYRLERDGFAPITISGTLAAEFPLLAMGESLKVFNPPLDGQPWTDSFGMDFSWVADKHVARLPVTAGLFGKFLDDSGSLDPYLKATVLFPDPDVVGEQPGVLVTREGADRFCEWLTRGSRVAGYLTAQHAYVFNEFAAGDVVAVEPGGTDELVLLMVAVEQSEYAQVTLTTTPAGVEVYRDGKRIGTSAETLRIGTGPQVLTLMHPGYESLEVELSPLPGDELEREIVLEKSRAARLGAEWENDLGMSFVPLGDDLLVGAHEVRVKDFRAFCDRSGHRWDHTPPFLQEDEHPVVKVTREDARAFCRWLSEVDLEAGLLEPGFVYRLPKDLEWSRAVGMPEEVGLSPASRDGQIKGLFPWGTEWPPPDGVANLRDRPGPGGQKGVANFSDGFADTAPVGSFPPNQMGIYDLSGNVWEWVEESYGGTGSLKANGVMRGGCFSNDQEVDLESSCRNPVDLALRGVLNGFRVVIAKSATGETELDQPAN